jgi:hypothetical protein
MSEDESGIEADNSMHAEFGKAQGHADTVTTIGARFGTSAPAPAPKAAAKSKKTDDE